MTTLPVIYDGILELECNLGGDYTFAGTVQLIAVIACDPRPRRLTKGQLARTYCCGHGEYTGAPIPPSRLLENVFVATIAVEILRCINPYYVPRTASEPESQ